MSATYIDNLRRMAQALNALTHPDYHSRPLDDYDNDMSAAEESDGPDPYDVALDSELEREARDGHQRD